MGDYGLPKEMGEPITLSELGRRLSTMRERLGLSLADVAARVSTDLSTIKQFESGEDIPLSLFLAILRDLTPGLELNHAFDAPRFNDLDEVRNWRIGRHDDHRST